MNNFKKVCVLKEACGGYSFKDKKLIGTLKIENSENIVNFEVTIVNFDAQKSKNLTFLIYDENNSYLYTEQVRQKYNFSKTISLNVDTFNFCVLIKETPILYYKESLSNSKIKEILRNAEKENNKQSTTKNIEEKTSNISKTQQSRRVDASSYDVPRPSGDNATTNGRDEYDDFKIANENYYKLEDVRIRNENVITKEDDKEKEKEVESERQFDEYEKDFSLEKEQRYYVKIVEKFNDLTSNVEKETELSQLLNGEFFKIAYDENRYYVVGKILENTEVKYIAYGIKGVYGETPKNFEEYAKFIPINNFNIKSDGYYVIFQSATTGEIIKNT